MLQNKGGCEACRWFDAPPVSFMYGQCTHPEHPELRHRHDWCALWTRVTIRKAG
jgi:hypothetical protein